MNEGVCVCERERGCLVLTFSCGPTVHTDQAKGNQLSAQLRPLSGVDNLHKHRVRSVAHLRGKSQDEWSEESLRWEWLRLGYICDMKVKAKTLGWRRLHPGGFLPFLKSVVSKLCSLVARVGLDAARRFFIPLLFLRFSSWSGSIMQSIFMSVRIWYNVAWGYPSHNPCSLITLVRCCHQSH